MLVNDEGINPVEIETDSQGVAELIQVGPHESSFQKSNLRMLVAVEKEQCKN